MKLLLILAGPLVFCIGVAFVMHFWDLIVRRGKLTLETHRRGAVLFWALMCTGYLSEIAMKVQSYLIHNGISVRTSHHVFGALLVLVSIATAGVIDLVSKNLSEPRITVN